MTQPATRFVGLDFGTTNSVIAALDTSTRTVPVYCLIQNPDGALRPGAYIGGTIYGAARANVVAVPQEAVQALDAGPAVFMPGKKPGVYVAQPVKTGETVAVGSPIIAIEARPWTA